MRMSSSIAAAVIAGALTACMATPASREPSEPMTMRVVCGAGDLVQCFEQPSMLCGRAGYDLFDEEGRPATAGDARYGTLVAKCRR